MRSWLVAIVPLLGCTASLEPVETDAAIELSAASAGGTCGDGVCDRGESCEWDGAANRNKVCGVLGDYTITGAAMPGGGTVCSSTCTLWPKSEDAFTIRGHAGCTSGAGECYWRMRVDPTRCSADHKCEDLVIIFSGGEFNCDNSDPDTVYNRAMDRYKAAGYVTVCAEPFTDNVDATTRISYVQEASRLDTLVRSITASQAIRAFWTGGRLLYSGISHGASAPVVVMGRTGLDDQLDWKGTTLTAACFLDGNYHPINTSNWLRDPANVTSCKTVRDQVTCDKYGLPAGCATPTAANTTAQNWANLQADTMTGSGAPPVTSFSIKSWKLIECGSAKQTNGACGNLSSYPSDDSLDNDWINKADIFALCDRIAAQPGYACTRADRLPNDGHLSCMGVPAGTDRCKSWFDALPAERKRIFATSGNHDANLGGLAGADAICQSHATAAGLRGVFKAWLSTSGAGNSAAERLTHFAGSYVETDGTVVATGWADLTDGTLASMIDHDESGVLRSGGKVWTNTSGSGASLGAAHCAGFTSNAATSSVTVGTVTAADVGWTQSTSVSCNNAFRLVCIEQ